LSALRTLLPVAANARFLRACFSGSADKLAD
jgi:hypothetical protein